MRELAHRYISGDAWAVCDECGHKYRRSQMLERWDGFLVCKSDWEPRHPQEFVRGKADKIVVANARPDQIVMEIGQLELLENLQLFDHLEMR